MTSDLTEDPFVNKSTEKLNPFAVQEPITEQPQKETGNQYSNGWKSISEKVEACPPGLEYMQAVDQLLVRQQIEVLEALTGWETQNKYQITNNMGQQVFFAQEQSTVCARMCLGPNRPFTMRITDDYGKEVLEFARPFRCSGGCCCTFCLQSMEVFGPPGVLLGSIEQQYGPINPRFDVKDSHNNTVLFITGPCCKASCCNDVVFRVYRCDDDDDEPIGSITKQWSGITREMFLDVDNYGVTFPMDLDVKLKSLLLGALFVIDFLFFEKK